MALRSRIEPIDREIKLMLEAGLSPTERSKLFGQWAGEQIDDARRINRAILNREPPYTVTVDGREGAPLSSVRPYDGVIVAEFQGLLTELLVWIDSQLMLHSPVKTGRYQKSHLLFADGQQTDVASAGVAGVYTFANSQPYARKIERGSSSQAPDGVYQAVAILASRRFGNVAKVRFTYASVDGGVKSRSSRQPAITVTVN